MFRPNSLLILPAIVLASTLLASCAGGPVVPDSVPDSTTSAEPSQTRPTVDLEFRMAAGLGSASGTERVTFTPDLEVCELVFRAWPNKPATARTGSSLKVTSVRVEGNAIVPEVSSAGAPSGVPGTLVEVPLPSCVPAGTPVKAELDFELTLGTGTDERVGVSRAGDLAWFGTAYPLLAWQNGIGWARDNAVAVTGETVTSETFDLASLRVIAPQELKVLGVGEPLPPKVDSATGLNTHEFRAQAVRDVTVTVGKIGIVEKRVGDTVIHVGGPEDRLAEPLRAWANVIADKVTDVSAYLGPVPDDHIWVSVIPDQTEGIEFSGAMQFGQLEGNDDEWLVTHEVAHLWVYGLVGNNQARHPWLDESFASFIQQVVDDPKRDPEPQHDYPDRIATEVGRPMEYWIDFRNPSRSYVSAVYSAGGDMLIEARKNAGAERFDAALRNYLQANAYQIATPKDVEAAFANVPGAVSRMRAAGALD